MITKADNNIKNISVSGIGLRRLYSLDLLKAVCAFLIVCIHAPFPGICGEYFTCLTRIAVPIFFMISGYFYTPTKVKNQINKVFYLLLVSNLGYFALGLIKSVIRHNLMDYIASIFTVKKLILFLTVNQSPFAVHLWYLGAILYVYIVFYYCGKYGWIHRVVGLFPFFLLCDLVLGKYSLLLFHRVFPILLVRNWLFVGIPFFSIGLLIRQNGQLLNQYCTKWALIVGMLFFSTTSVLEKWFLVLYHVNAIRDQYISTAFLSTLVFLYFLYFVDNQQGMFVKIGCYDSTGVFIIHYALIMLLGLIMRNNPQFDVIYKFIRPLLIFVLSVLLVRLKRKVCR